MATVAEELSRFGAHLEVFEDSVTVYPATLHAPDGEIHGHNDHRVVMSMAVLLSAFGGDIEGAEAVRKSFPDFFDVMKSLGFEVTIHEI